ncbi:DUF6988 family protein [Variovorax sp. LjRoot178]|uniref:DUF6988 family protein n=1 Tax=Variovorax sp. LjRoot178 TaxID=3342277 RepID=UPI003ECEF72B
MEESVAVNAAVDRSLELSRWISDHYPPSFTHEGQNMLAVAFFSIALDHREAILCLLRHGARTSAFALARSVYEAGVKGSWAQHCATNEDHTRAFGKGVLPSFDAMVRRLGKIKATNGVFGRGKELAWTAISDYAHGGMKQVIRWVGSDGVAPRHTDVEAQELINLIDIYGLLACMGVVGVTGGSLDAHAAKAHEVIDRHKRWKAEMRAGTPAAYPGAPYHRSIGNARA